MYWSVCFSILDEDEEDDEGDEGDEEDDEGTSQLCTNYRSLVIVFSLGRADMLSGITITYHNDHRNYDFLG